LPIQPFTSSCKADEQISAVDETKIGQAALTFVQDALGENPSAAYSAFTAEAKDKVPLPQFVSALQSAIKPTGPYKDLRIVGTYLAQVTGGGREQRVVCGNLSRPESWVAVNVKPGPAEAHVVIEAHTTNNSEVFVVWLLPEQGNWRVQYVHFALSGVVGKSPADLRKIAEAEQQKQHNLNAFLLFATALQLTDRGPYFQLGIRPDIEKDLSEIKKPEFLVGQPPFIWNVGTAGSFKLLNVGLIGVGGKIYLQVDHRAAPWTDDKDVVKSNRSLIAALDSRYPEYREAFAGIVVRAHEDGTNRTYGTVDENKN